MCISANRIVVRLRVTTTVPSSENVPPATMDATSALWNIGYLRYSISGKRSPPNPVLALDQIFCRPYLRDFSPGLRRD